MLDIASERYESETILSLIDRMIFFDAGWNPEL